MVFANVCVIFADNTFLAQKKDRQEDFLSVLLLFFVCYFLFFVSRSLLIRVMYIIELEACIPVIGHSPVFIA